MSTGPWSIDGVIRATSSSVSYNLDSITKATPDIWTMDQEK